MHRINLFLAHQKGAREEFWGAFVDKAVLGVLGAQDQPRSLCLKRNCFLFSASLFYSSSGFRGAMLERLEKFFSISQRIGSGQVPSVEAAQAFQALKEEIF